MRGKPHCFRCRPYSPRIIPAHAGQTRQTLHIECGLEEHPRACGANSRSKNLNPRRLGSSPRMRGKLRHAGGLPASERIIPAHAGQTTIFSFNSARWSDHPRACGANGVWGVFNIRGHGSSPRMRGKPAVIYPRLGARRIIPAHAGQTPPSTTRDTCRPDHPRACGANKGAFAQTLSADGSSPRMRGKLFHNCSVLCFVRIIPAHAGQTMVAGRHSTPSTDHPRACGANSVRLSKRRHATGSSPRMRGKRTAA